jgi:putative transposase
MNRKYGRTGALWEGRFRSSVVQSERYLLACYRYIELNPVRAELVPHPEGYEWSSYRANALGTPSAVVTPHADYMRLGGTDSERRRTYADLVAKGLQETDLAQIRLAARGGLALA